MKKQILFIILSFLPFIVYAQELNPGGQTQSHMGDKNIMVDHCTGIFHYRVPLYTLGSGDFGLSISLDYQANGVKRSAMPGIIGYNWVLNTDGIITRTIRGGIADEENEIGYLWAENSQGALPLERDIDKVNKRERDGESDIFTAVFRDRTVNFIIRMDKDKKIYAEPLERTNIRIDCRHYTSGRCVISGWTITDEDGTRYIYETPEWLYNINTEEAITRNSLHNKNYISSWHMNRIEPMNGRPIVFCYKDKKAQIEHNYRTSVKYHYGQPVKERKVNLGKYKKDFHNALREAIIKMEFLGAEIDMNNDPGYFDMYGNWVENPYFEINNQIIRTNLRVMGMISNIKLVVGSANNLLHKLNACIDYYGIINSIHASSIVYHLKAAKSYIIYGFTNMETLSEQESSNVISFMHSVPLLEKIKCGDKELTFDYTENNKLYEIILSEITGRRESSVVLSGKSNLDIVTFKDRKHHTVETIRFDYYSAGYVSSCDPWGYFRDYRKANYDVDIESTKHHSLKKIVFPYGGSLNIDYESNSAVYKFAPGTSGFITPIGGIRVKSLVFRDSRGERVDSVLYAYPRPGKMVYDSYNCLDFVRYDGFTDWVKRSEINSSGYAFLNTGNNGVFYPFVIETSSGKGVKAYWFHIPSVYCYWDVEEPLPYPFWLNGLPLATAEYDDKGNLKRLLKNKYYTGLSYGMGINYNYYFEDNGDYFDTEKYCFSYHFELPQLKPYEYYLDYGEQSDFFRKMNRIALYADKGRVYYINPYEDVFLNNIAPRTHCILPFQNYNLCYGGKTLLKEQVEYRFEKHLTDKPSYDDLKKFGMGMPYLKTEYHYDNSETLFAPTRIVRKDIFGNTVTEIKFRISDIKATVSPFISGMKKANFISPIIKEITLVNGKLIRENVATYREFSSGKKTSFLPVGTYSYGTIQPLAYTLKLPVDKLFTYSASAYRKEMETDYREINNLYFPVSHMTLNEHTATVYNSSGERLVLKAKNVGPKDIAVVDRYKYIDVSHMNEVIGNNLNLKNISEYFIKTYEYLTKADNSGQCPGMRHGVEYMNYTRSVEHKTMLNVISAMASGRRPRDTQKFQSQLDSLRQGDNIIVWKFYAIYMGILQNEPIFEGNCDDFGLLVNAIMNPDMVNSLFFENLVPIDLETVFIPDEAIQITSFSGSKRFRIYVLAKGAGGSIPYSIYHSKGRYEGKINFSGLSDYGIQVIELDLNTYSGIKSFRLYPPVGVSMLVAVPANTLFEAVSYNTDGSVFCKFDHSGMLERYEYDAAGRIVRKYDGEGNILEENIYNRILP